MCCMVDDKLDNVVYLRLTASDKKLLERAKRRLRHRSLSEWARLALLSEAVRVLKEVAT